MQRHKTKINVYKNSKIMKNLKKLVVKSGITTTVLLVMLLSIPVEALGQDPTVVDAKHYTVEFENDQVRVLRISYAPGEESVMHEHPNGVAIF